MGSAPFSLFSRIIIAPVFGGAYSWPATLFSLTREIKITDSCGFQLLVFFRIIFRFARVRRVTSWRNTVFVISRKNQSVMPPYSGATPLLIRQSPHTYFYVNWGTKAPNITQRLRKFTAVSPGKSNKLLDIRGVMRNKSSEVLESLALELEPAED